MPKQVGAIPVRKGPSGQLEVLLVTSRDTGRWIIPKGWTSKRMTDSKAAAREARQEGGVSGKITSKPIGSYRYRKMEGAVGRMVDVTVFLLTVKKEKSRWSEQDQRER
ncbi:MAG TPA: NUDIX hydrolase, partial [Hyphomicrobium sp.]|nr:NUDIX hydrolase [Hyphomicrobium sp.]